jgi:integrase
MINITIPEINITVEKHSFEKIPDNTSGVYCLYNEEDKLLYIGKTRDLKRRAKEHFSGYSNMGDYSHNFYKCSCIYVISELDMDIYETYMINTLKPALNIEKVITYSIEDSIERYKRDTEVVLIKKSTNIRPLKDVKPLKSIDKIEQIKDFLKSKSKRNFLFFLIGVSTGLIGEVLIRLRVSDVNNLEFIKVGIKKYPISEELGKYIKTYIQDKNPDDYLFQSRNGKNKPITRGMATVFLREASEAIGMKTPISLLTLRRTFAYFHYKEYKDLEYLKSLLGHQEIGQTLKMLGRL